MAGFDVSEFVPINVPSLYIPRVFQNIPDEYILNTIMAVGLGTISHIDSSVIQDNPKFKGVRIHFTAWNLSNENARRARDRLLRNEEIKVMYDDPWFWKIRPTRPAQQHQGQEQEQQQQQHIDNCGYSSDNDNTIMRIKAANNNRRARLFPESMQPASSQTMNMRMPSTLPTYNRFKDSRGRSYRGDDGRRPYQQQQSPPLSLVIPEKQEEQEEQEEPQQKYFTPHSPTEPPPHIRDNAIESDDQSTASSLTDRDEPVKKTTLIKKRRIIIKTP
jgi:hypothetical protein